ncbi:MAG: aromatic-ring-hydroxylating dioxygenase subunit beta [Pseudomonadales bacterium]|nr:aromatic-ring-hydroxylating dioxygenase subunit beta [Pseudomonadales bacterium]
MDNQELVHQVKNFLFEEARLMDENNYLGWLELFDSECSYWIPSNKEDYDPAQHVSILYCDRSMLEHHIQRLVDGKAFAQIPKSRTQRLVSNVLATQKNNIVTVTSSFIVTEVRGHQQHIHGGRSEYQLKENDSSYLIQKKKVILLGLDEPQYNITFLI